MKKIAFFLAFASLVILHASSLRVLRVNSDSVGASGAPFRSLGVLNLAHPSFIAIDDVADTNGKSAPALLISTFAAFATDYVYIVRDIGSQLGNFANISPEVVTKEVTWPNELSKVPEDAIDGHPNLLAAPGGFLVPFKGNGAVTLIDLNIDVPQIHKITQTNDMFYHRVRWLDADGDGKLDIITAGAQKGLFSSASKLYWLRQPDSYPLDNPWETHELISGPDVFFEIADLDGDGNDELIAAEFFSSKLSIYTNLTWENPSAGFKEIVVDDSIGPVFDVQYVDVNGDGKKELLVSNHVNDADKSALYVYEVPSNLQGTFKKHTIASGFVTRNKKPGNASPGDAVLVRPKAGTGRPYMLLAGDGAQQAYLLVPDEKTTFGFNQLVVVDCKGTVGTIAAGDVDGDGYAEFFIPDYDNGRIYGYTFAP